MAVLPQAGAERVAGKRPCLLTEFVPSCANGVRPASRESTGQAGTRPPACSGRLLTRTDPDRVRMIGAAARDCITTLSQSIETTFDRKSILSVGLARVVDMNLSG